MGVVFEARDRALERVVAVKNMQRRLAGRRGFSDRFIQEARLSGQLDHPGIIPVYSLEIAEDDLSMAMKLVDGQDLQAYLDSCGAQRSGGGDLPEGQRVEDRLEIFVRICEPVAHAHRMDVIHRDLKPENVLLAAGGEVYVVDWGIAKRVGDTELRLEALPEGRKTETQTGTLLGTPSFMSPEQASGALDELDGRSDIYSLGLILYELVTLQRANTGPTTLLVAMQAQQGFRAPTGAVSDRALAAIIARATAVKPADRYATATALADDVRRYLRREETHALPDTRWRRVIRWVSDHAEWSVAFLFAVLLLAVLSVGTLVVADMQEDIRRQAAVHARDAAMAAFIQEVTAKGNGFDRRAHHHQSLVESLSRDVTRLLAHPPLEQGEIHWHRERDTHPPPQRAYDERYRQRVSFAEPTYWAPPSGDLERIEAQARRLYPVRADLRDAMLRSIDITAATWSREDQEALLRTTTYPTAWSYLALESGLAITFPGIEDYGADYDPRTRPWYTRSLNSAHATWGRVYPESSGAGLMLPCTQTLFDADGEVLGVVGLDVSLDGILDHMRMPGEEVSGVWLADASGLTIVDSEMEGRIEVEAMTEVPSPGVMAHIRAGEPYGWVQEAEDVFVFTRLPSLGWYYVVRRDRASIQGPPDSR